MVGILQAIDADIRRAKCSPGPIAFLRSASTYFENIGLGADSQKAL